MSHRVLIIDDDQDFCNLLRDVMEQAGYQVDAVFSPVEALLLAEVNPYQLIITDQRMPELTGLDFIVRIRRLVPDIPIIMVSGFLDNHTIRELIRQGVGGVFMKPLNIFSLLKKAGQLIERRMRPSTPTQPAAELVRPRYFQHSLPYAFTSLPCKDAVAVSFAEKLYQHRNFRSTLALVGEEGMDFASLCMDLCQFPSELTGELVLLQCPLPPFSDVQLILESPPHATAANITFAVIDADSLNSSEISIILALARKEGVMAFYPQHFRFIFCFRQELDLLYENGEIDDNLFMMAGTTEVRVPPLRDMREEIFCLAERYLWDNSKGQVTLEPDAEQYLHHLPWPGNVTQLRSVLKVAMQMVQDSAISEDFLRYVVEKKPLPSQSGTVPKSVQEYLRMLRDEYLQATLDCTHGNLPEAAEALAVDPAFFRHLPQS